MMGLSQLQWISGMAFLGAMWCGISSVQAQWQLALPDPLIEGYTNFLGQGLSFVDFNLDGWDDLTVPNASGGLNFHVGGPAGFTQVNLGIEPAFGRPTAVVWLDIDNDGDRDFLHTSSMAITFFGGASQLSRSRVWINEDGYFVDRTSEWGWDVLDNRPCTGLAFHDMDGDGDLDGMVSNYALPCSDLWMTENVLMENAGDSFLDVSVSSGLANGLTPTFQSVWMHLDGDSLMDLFVINDAGVEGGCVPTNEAYLNNGDGTFTESSALLGLDVTMSSMSSTIGDPDADGAEEIFVTNQSLEPFYTYPQVTSAYFDRDSAGDFTEASAVSGLDLTQWSWSAMWVDADLNGWDDLMVATYPYNVPGDGEDTEFYENCWMEHPGADLQSGAAAFADHSGEWPGELAPLFCLVRGDLDQDGDPDMVGLGTGQYLTVWDNASEESHPGHHGLTVLVCGTHSNSEAIGTRLVLHVDGHPQQRVLRAGEDLFAQHSTTQFFGLGNAAQADSLEVFWPDGAREVHVSLAADSALRLVQGAEEAQLSLLSLDGDVATLQLDLPPKWTGVSWNGEEGSELTWSGPVGAALTWEGQWFHGLFTLSGAADWSALQSVEAGCTNPVADNYAPTVELDDGSCTYQGFCGAGTVWSSATGHCVVADPNCPQDVNGDGSVGIADILYLLSYFGSDCLEFAD